MMVNPRDLACGRTSGGDKKHYPIAFNAFLKSTSLSMTTSYEEMKMINETKKIM